MKYRTTFLCILVICVGCGKKNGQGPEAAQLSSQSQEEGHRHLSCTVTSSKTLAQDDEKISLRIRIDGGNSPYKILGYSGSTNKTEFVLSTSFENHSTSNQTIQRQVKVSDAEGESTACSFKITIAPGR